MAAVAAAKSLQSCPTLCDPIDGSPPGPAVPGILQARPLEWVAISSSNAWKWKVKVKLLSHVQLLATPWTAAYQAPLSMGFSRQEYWRREWLPSPVFLGFPCGSVDKESACNAGDLGLIPGLRRSPGEGNSYPLQYSGLENSMDCVIHVVVKSRTWLSNFHLLKLGRSQSPKTYYLHFERTSLALGLQFGHLKLWHKQFEFQEIILELLRRMC